MNFKGIIIYAREFERNDLIDNAILCNLYTCNRDNGLSFTNKQSLYTYIFRTIKASSEETQPGMVHNNLNYCVPYKSVNLVMKP